MKNLLKKADLAGLALIGAALVAYNIRQTWSTLQWVAVGVGAVLIVVSIALRFREIREGLFRRSSRYGINSASSVVFLVGILAGINYIGAQNPKRFDMTTEKLYSLSEQSIAAAEQVQEDIRIRAFYPGGDYPPVKEIFELYTSRNPKITYQFHDPDKEPQLARQYQIQTYGDFQNPMSGESLRFGTVILEKGDRTERIEKQEALREEDLTNALMKVVKGEKKTIYFLEGHGERRHNDTDRTGYDQARNALETENYAVNGINLVQQAQVPGDASVLVIAGPTTEPFPAEIEAIEKYLETGGSVLVMVDPDPGVALSGFLKKWQVDVGNNFVVDASGMGRLFGTGPTIPLVSTYSPHRITQRFNVMTFFPNARSVTPGSGGEGITVEKLLETSPQSWGETNLRGNEATFDQKADLQGPVTLGVVVTKTLPENKKARMVVFGDSDFGSNGGFRGQGNGNLFLNTVNFLAQDESFISIRPKSPDDRRLTMTQAQAALSYYITIWFLPLGILVLGVTVWNRRRK